MKRRNINLDQDSDESDMQESGTSELISAR